MAKNHTKFRDEDQLAFEQISWTDTPLAQSVHTTPWQLQTLANICQSYSLQHPVGEVLLCDRMHLLGFSPGDKELTAPPDSLCPAHIKHVCSLFIRRNSEYCKLNLWHSLAGLLTHTWISSGKLWCDTKIFALYGLKKLNVLYYTGLSTVTHPFMTTTFHLLTPESSSLKLSQNL